MNASTVALLHEIVRRESLSLLTYVGEAFPWTGSRGVETLARLKQIVAANNAAVAAIGRFLAKRRYPLGSLGSYPGSFTTINFLSLDHILRKVVESEIRNVATIERDLAALTDKDALEQVQKLLTLKKKQLESLEFMASSHSQPAAS